MNNCPQPDYTGLVAAGIALATSLTLLIRAFLDNHSLKKTVESQSAITRNVVREETANISTNKTPQTPPENVDK